jgi:PAS domain S-box-containing protein/diguanylate cyclase (GGDEF)-like protein
VKRTSRRTGAKVADKSPPPAAPPPSGNGATPTLTGSYFEALALNSADAMVVIDVEGTIRFASPALAIFGYTAAELLGRKVRDFIHADDREAGVAGMRSSLAASGAAVVEWRVLVADGTWCWVEETITDLTTDPAVAGIVIHLRDITIRRRTEEALRSSQEHLRSLFYSSPIGTALVDLDGKVLEANDALLALLGYQADELVGQHFGEITHPEDLAKDLAQFERLSTAQIDRYQIDKRYLRKDGTEIVGRLTVSTVPDDEGRPRYFIAVVEDVTESVHVHKRLAENEERLRMALDAARMATWQFDNATQRITVSENFNEVLGIPPGAANGTFQSFLRYIHPEDIEQFEESVRGADRNSEFAHDSRFNSPLRGPRCIHNRGRVVLSAGGQRIRFTGVVMDVTDSRAAEHERLEIESAFRQTVEATSDAFVGVRSDGVISDWNLSAQRMFGWTAEEAVGEPVDMIIPPELRSDYRSRLLRAGQHRMSSHLVAGPIELTGMTRDDRSFPIEMTGVGVNRGDALVFNAFVRDITARKAAEERLVHQAFTDDATGLPNRAKFEDLLDAALARTPPAGSIAVLFIGVDHLKVVNDTLGLRAGDDALIAVSRRIAGVIGPRDVLAHFAGDEFVILSEGVVPGEPPAQLPKDVIDAVSAPLNLEGHDLRPGVTIGIAVNDQPSCTDDLLRDASLAMFRAKDLGGGHFAVFDSVMRDEALRLICLQLELRTAIDEDQLRVHYQPVFSAAGEIVSVEALVRWQHPERGLLAPRDFIPAAEESGIIVDLGQWVLRSACRQSAAWLAAGAPALTIAVNLSSRQLLQSDLCALVASVLAEEGVAPSSLCLELTESALLVDSDLAWKSLVELRSLGIELAIDDFGTGYSSLTYLRRFPVQILKLDRSFVTGVTADPEDAAIVGSTIELAHALGLVAVAEGVETQEQLVALRRLGCDQMQGFLWSVPLPAEVFADRFLRETRDDKMPPGDAADDVSSPTSRLHAPSPRGPETGLTPARTG